MEIKFTYSKNTKKARVLCKDPDIIKEIRHAFSVINETKAFQSKFAKSRHYALTPTGQFEVGLFIDVLKHVSTEYPTAKIVVSDALKADIMCGLDVDNISTCESKEYQLRYYQEDIIKRAIKQGRGVCVLGTGGGKTLTIATLINTYFQHAKNKETFKCLIIVPDIGLVSQTYNDFIDYEVPFTMSRWSGLGDVDISTNIIITNMKKLIRSKERDWINYVDLVIIDECHKIRKGNKISKIIQKINTPNRYGFTGTLNKIDNKVDNWSIIGKIGPVFYEKGSDELRDEGYLTNAEAKVLKIKYKKRPKHGVGIERYRNELDFIYENDFREKLLLKLCDNFNNNILILVNHIRHGKRLAEVLSKLTDRAVFFVEGKVPVEDREEIQQKMEIQDNIICIAMTSIFSTGINIKNIHMIIFAAGGKAFIRTVQAVGRGLRLHENKDKLTIIDICDVLEYGIKHLLKRLEIYDVEKIPYSISTVDEKIT